MRAGIIGIAYVLCRGLALDVYTSILSGTSPTGGPISVFDAILAFTYMLVHFAFVLGVPGLIVGAGLLAAVESVWTGLRR